MARIVDFFDGAQSETTPTIGNIIASGLITYPDDATYEATEQGAPAQGNIYFNTTDNVMKVYDLGNTTWRQIQLTPADQANVNIVAADLNGADNIGTVSTNIANVNTTATNIANINTTAGIDTEITNVSGISSAISAVNSNSTNINAVNANSTKTKKEIPRHLATFFPVVGLSWSMAYFSQVRPLGVLGLLSSPVSEFAEKSSLIMARLSNA